MTFPKYFIILSLLMVGCFQSDGAENHPFEPEDFRDLQDKSGPERIRKDNHPDADGLGLAAEMSDPDRCDDDAWGCPGMPCLHESCWDSDADGWILGACEGVVYDDTGTIVDPGVCCNEGACED